jgi:hypothetical protein
VPELFDWILGLLTGLAGLVMTGVGISQYLQVDRAAIADSVDSESFELEGISRTEFIDAVVPFVDWFMVGVAVTGVVMMVAAVVFVYLRRQTRQRVDAEGGTTATFWACAVYGSAVGALTPIPVVSFLFAGGVASALADTDSSARIGALAGVLGGVLSLLLLVFVSAGILAGGAAIGELATGAVIVGLLVVAQFVLLAVNAGLGAAGGFLAERFA